MFKQVLKCKIVCKRPPALWILKNSSARKARKCRISSPFDKYKKIYCFVRLFFLTLSYSLSKLCFFNRREIPSLLKTPGFKTPGIEEIGFKHAFSDHIWINMNLLFDQKLQVSQKTSIFQTSSEKGSSLQKEKVEKVGVENSFCC